MKRELFTLLGIAIVIIAVLLTFSECSKKTIKIEPESPAPIEIIQHEEKPILKFKTEPEVEQHIIKTVVVYFKFDSYELQNSEWWKISNIDKPVELTGGCCPIGTDSYNYTLGLRRAMTVRDKLEAKGIKVLNYKSVGENDLVTYDRSQYYLNRRVEVKY